MKCDGSSEQEKMGRVQIGRGRKKNHPERLFERISGNIIQVINFIVQVFLKREK